MSRSTDSAARGLGNSELAIKTLCASLKQRPGSNHCGYYICCMMSNTSAYTRHPNLWKEYKDKRRNLIKEDELLGLVGDLCNFIIDEIVDSRGAYHDVRSDLGSNPLHQHLRETHRLCLGR
ncbi:uncharacterized protein LOC110435287 [Sorghum bicolor]|uniref:uncharacterized protein LOC110435287 n=1 Tax=Sorghum bicolor TaxID=4558 RepID=UPI000B423651|nr:uncharacterized protein LOC110435287 [Sorghum bicolor]|eukprot:XP_021316392.1 uncharacterized protein LOC110435287 [Sorghum bicolor]